jgi:hypothetical protein
VLTADRVPDELVDAGTAVLTRRRRLAARLGDVEQVLAGSLVEQSRRCGKPGCRCAKGDPHGPYAYFTPKTAGRGRMKYVPSRLITTVRSGLARGEQVETVLARSRRSTPSCWPGAN